MPSTGSPLTSNPRRLTDRSPALGTFASLFALVAVLGCIWTIGAGGVATAAAPFLVLAGAAGPALWWKWGIYATDEGVKLWGIAHRTVIPWAQFQQATVERVSQFMRTVRAVVITTVDGPEVTLYEWNEESAFMWGAGSVDGLCASLNSWASAVGR